VIRRDPDEDRITAALVPLAISLDFTKSLQQQRWIVNFAIEISDHNVNPAL
jgi:hypothetical protein